MAYYAALVPLVQLLEDIIHRDRYPNLLFDKQNIASIYEKFSLLQTLLDYLPKDRKEADSLERQIRDAAYQAQDIVESQISDQVYREDKTHGVGHRKVKEELDSIVEKLMSIKKSHTTEDLQLNYHSSDAGTSNQASGTNTMEGFEKHLIAIIDQLCWEPSKRQVISIVGMGGIGKTTLARNIFEDERLYHFDCRVWVTISQDYQLEKILLDIVACMNIKIKKFKKVVELGEQIYKHLKGRRYLIILDDLWDTKVWDDIKRILPDDSNGSRILITTRISHVAYYANISDFFHQLQFLNEDQSWNLFRAKVFCPPELEDLGRLITKNCRGLPLAIVVVAGFLSKVNKKRYDWEEIARNLCTTAVENDEHFSKILSLSYNHLPHHLKPLFLYIGGFPEDYEIPVFKLVNLWIAEGFLKPIESKSLEVVAEEYLEDLVNRNLLLITKKSFNGKIRCCGIHDVVRNLCIERARYENFLHVLDDNDYLKPKAARNIRRISIHPARSMFVEVEECGSCVRSIIRFSHVWTFLSFGLGLKLLRVLDAVKIMLFGFPVEILELFHLRYLALSHRMLPIPPSIYQLQNLQTLVLVSLVSRERFGESLSLPCQIWEMPNLRHIIVCRLELSLLSNERTVGEPSILENLQTLSCVANVRFTNEIIEMIPNLKKLKVWYEETHEVWQKFRLDNLVHLCQLEILNIQFHYTFFSPVQHLPETFAFPLKLKRLSLKYCKIPWKDMSVVGSLPNLQVLKLRYRAFVGENWEPVEGEFLQLKFLLMQDLDLKYWQAESTHFPRLQCLKIISCWELQDIPSEIGEISTLELIEVKFSKLAAKSAMKLREEQRDFGNDELQVHVSPQ